MDDADKLLESYLGGKVPEPKGTEAAPMTGTDYLNSYLGNDTKAKAITIKTVAPPISDATAEQSDEINAQPAQTGGKNPRRYASPSSLIGDVAAGASELPGDIARATGEAGRAGIDTFKSGVTDVTENRPASGVGKMGLGALQYVGSPVTGLTKTLVEEPITNLTGSKEAGERAGLISSFALPVAPAVKMANAAKPSNMAFKDFIDGIGGVSNIPAFLKEYVSNPRLSAMDVSPSLLQTTQKLAVTPGPHQNLLNNVVEQRLAGAKGAVTNAYNTTMGAPVNVLDKIDELTKAAKDVGNKKIQPVLKQTNPVDVTPAIEHIDNILKPGVNSVVSSGTELATTKVKQALVEARRYLTDGKSNRTDPQDLHTIQSALGNTAYKLSKSPNPEDRMLSGALTKVKEKIVDAIDAASPQINGKGSYRPARAEWADERHVMDGFEKGQEILKNRPSQVEDRPEYWERWIKNAKPTQLDAAREGARIAVDNQIRGMRNAVGQKGTEIPQIEFNKDKLSLLFGKKEIDEMARKLQHERKIADTDKKLFEGSQTAMRTEADARVSKRTDAGLEGSSIMPYIAEGIGAYSTGFPGIGASVYKGLDLAKRHIANPIMNKRVDAKNLELARLASATGAEKDELVKRLSALVTPPKPSMLSRSGNALARVIGP